MKRQRIKYLPEELIGEILLASLPIKPLLRFKSVSKSWRSLISSANFEKDHINRSNSDPDLTHHMLIGTSFNAETAGFRLRSCSLKFLLDEPNQNEVVPTYHRYPSTGNTDFSIRILGSCNGLILVEINTLFLWNPSTTKLKAIPPPTPCPVNPEYYFSYGLGYDDSTNDYKVVCIIYREKPGYIETYQTKIYSVGTDSWKKIDKFEKCILYEGKFVSGKLHWLRVDERELVSLGLVEGQEKREIVSLALVEGQEKYQIVSSPKCSSNKDVLKLENLGGRLSLICSSSGFIGMKDINVWVMMQYGVAESWTKIWTFSDFGFHGCAIPFWMTNNGDTFVLSRESHFDELEVVAVCNGKVKLREYPIVFWKIVAFDSTPIVCIESLVSP